MCSLVEESLSVSGILLGKTMGRAPELAERFTRESAELADLEVRSRMAGRWRMASGPDGLRDHARARVLVRRLVDRPGRRRDLDRHAGRLHHAADAAVLPDRQSLLSVGLDVQTSLALFDRIFEYLDLPVDITEREDARELGDVRGEVRFEGVSFAYDVDGAPTLEDVDIVVPAGSTTAIVGETGSGKTTMGYLVARLYDPTGGR